MRQRAIDDDNDWQFGKGQNDYVRGINAVAQDINTRLGCFLGDCFFDASAGLDWFNLLGSKDQTSLNLAIAAVILNTQNVNGLVQLSVVLNSARNLSVTYEVQTVYSRTVTSVFQFSASPI